MSKSPHPLNPPRKRKQKRRRNAESFRQTGGIHIDIGSDVKGSSRVNPLLRGFSRATVSENIRREIKRGHPVAQAGRMAFDAARKAYRRLHPSGRYPRHLQLPRPKLRPNPGVSREVQEAARLFKGFRGANPDEAVKVRWHDTPKAVLTVGTLVEVTYDTVRDGERALYTHKFQTHARPLLVVTSDGRQLYLLGGAYSVTDRGITDAPKRRR